MSLRVTILAGLAILGIGLLAVWQFAPSVFAEARSLLLQLGDAEGADRLHKIGRHSHQQTHFSLKSTWWCGSNRRGPLTMRARAATLLS